MAVQTQGLSQLTESQLLAPLGILFDQKISKFPGTLPVSLDDLNLHELKYGYAASLKADGERVWVFLSGQRFVMMRRNGYYQTTLLPFVLSGDYVFDAEYDDEQNLLLLFDSLLYNNQPSWRLDYRQRVELTLHFLCSAVPKVYRSVLQDTFVSDPKPLPSHFQYGTTWRLDNGLNIQVKPIYVAADAAKLWANRHGVRYHADGVIFTQLWSRYSLFSESLVSVLKWKPCVTLDFLVTYRDEQAVEKRDSDDETATTSCQVNVSQLPTTRNHANYCDSDFAYLEPFCNPTNRSECNVLLKSVHDSVLVVFSSATLDLDILAASESKVCEFAWDADTQTWAWQRIRADKTAPNRMETVYGCLRSITSNISMEDIEGLFDTTRKLTPVCKKKRPRDNV